jgi:anti-anti-sigma factor
MIAGVSAASPPPGFAVTERREDERTILALEGELDISSASMLEESAERVVAAEETGAVVLDLGGLSFVDSTGLRAIVNLRDRCGKEGRTFTMLPGPRTVQRLFELTGLIDVLPFESSQLDSAER